MQRPKNVDRKLLNKICEEHGILKGMDEAKTLAGQAALKPDPPSQCDSTVPLYWSSWNTNTRD